MICLECSAPFTAYAKGRVPQRFCGKACKRKWNHYRESNGALFYDLIRIMRRDRTAATENDVWTKLCRLERAMFDRENGRRTWKPVAMALADIDALDRPTLSPTYEKPS